MNDSDRDLLLNTTCAEDAEKLCASGVSPLPLLHFSLSSWNEEVPLIPRSKEAARVLAPRKLY